MKIEVIKNKIHTGKKKNLCFCHFSDLHFSQKYNLKKFDEIKNEVGKIKPDYIFITGDIIDNTLIIKDKNMKKLYQFLKELGKISPILCILGNHDVTKSIFPLKHKYEYNKEYIKNLKEIPNLFLLQNEKYQDENISVFGYEQSYSLFIKEDHKEQEIINEINKKIKSIKWGNTYNIFLIHSPFIISKKGIEKKLLFLQNIDLVLCGHAHGGLIPFFLSKRKGNRGLISPTMRLFPKNVRGMIKGKTNIIINTAIIKLSYTSFLFRYFNFLFPSSLNKIEISSKKEEKR